MDTIKTEVRGADKLTLFWGQYFPETPVCSHPDCISVATEVDAFFPYIDDFNRCDLHFVESGDVTDNRTAGATTCGHRARRHGTSRSGKGRITRITWRPPR